MRLLGGQGECSLLVVHCCTCYLWTKILATFGLHYFYSTILIFPTKAVKGSAVLVGFRMLKRGREGRRFFVFLFGGGRGTGAIRAVLNAAIFFRILPPNVRSQEAARI